MKTHNIPWKLLAGLFLFIGTIAIFYFSMGKFWFADDDLGTIVNGLIYSKNDFIRVFSSDCRSFIVPINYQRSLPNFISGFLRPIQNVVFTIIHYCAGFDPYAYFFVNVLIHACNAVLLFYLALLVMPCSFAFLAGALFAIYPEYAWVGWIASLPNVLSLFLFLLSILCFRTFVIKHDWKAWVAYASSGILFFLALLSRESVVLMPLWIAAGVFFFVTKQDDGLFKRLWTSFCYTSIFFVAHVAYIVMRMWAFGFESLTRTYNNLFLRFPWLCKILGHQTSMPPKLPTTSSPANASAVIDHVSGAQQKAGAVSLFDSVTIKIQKFFGFVQRWLEVYFSIDVTTIYGSVLLFLLAGFVGIFLWYAYRNHKQALLWLLLGIVCASWPGFLAYPCSRYLNLAFPFITLLFVGGMYLSFSAPKKRWFLYLTIPLTCVALLRGIQNNVHYVAQTGHNAWNNSERFRTFWETHAFDEKVKVILLGSPFVSDIASIFQVGFNNLKMQVAFELFSTYAQQSVFGCKLDYCVTNVPSKLVPIEHGFRFISGDKEHCAWWMHFSDHPIRFNTKTRAYEWMSEDYQVDRWYQSSMGKFKIHEMIDGKYITDVSFIFDPEWIDENTVFVTWDTQGGKYCLLEARHL